MPPILTEEVKAAESRFGFGVAATTPLPRRPRTTCATGDMSRPFSNVGSTSKVETRGDAMAEMQRLGPLLAGWNRRATDTSSESDADDDSLEALERDESLWTPDGERGCEICGGAGYVRVSRPVGDPEFGRVQPCECRRADEEARTAARLQRLSNLGPLSDARLSEEQEASSDAVGVGL